MGSVSLTLPADFNTELNGKQDGMPANLQIDSSSKGIEQRDEMPANCDGMPGMIFYVFVFCWTLEATLGTTLGPLFAVFSTIWARLRPL